MDVVGVVQMRCCLTGLHLLMHSEVESHIIFISLNLLINLYIWVWLYLFGECVLQLIQFEEDDGFQHLELIDEFGSLHLEGLCCSAIPIGFAEQLRALFIIFGSILGET